MFDPSNQDCSIRMTTKLNNALKFYLQSLSCLCLLNDLSTNGDPVKRDVNLENTRFDARFVQTVMLLKY